jgi:hypothetical protein
MIVLFIVLARNKLRIPLEGTYSGQNFRAVPFLRSDYRAASLKASVGSPPGCAEPGHILSDTEPLSTSAPRHIYKTVRLRKPPLR